MLKFIKPIIFPLIIVIIQTGCEPSSSSNQTNATPTKTNTKKADIKVLFNLPLIIGKDINDVRKALESPIDKDIEPTKLQAKMGVDEWNNNFEKEGFTLVVTFNPKTRKVIDFFIGTKDPSGTTNDYSDLLQKCNVTNDNPKYSIIPVPAIKDNTKYTGIRIMEK